MDLIDRQAAIDAIVAWTVEDRPDVEMPTDLIDRIKALPSAHCDFCPYPEDYDGRVTVVRCKDCKYHGCNTCGHKLGLIAAFDNDFCSFAERRTDETD